MLKRFAAGMVIAALAGAAAAQQMYRWLDENGRTHVTDTPPPPGAKVVQTTKPGASANTGDEKDKDKDKSNVQQPFVLARAMKEYPVTLYTSPNCTDPCRAARALLNKRGVPFKEVQVWEEEGNAELKNLTGSTQVPALKVGSSVQSGYEPTAYTSLLDTAGYPREGVLPAGQQADPGRPEGYVPPEERDKPKAAPVKPEAQAPQGPYSPGAKPQRAQPRTQTK
jgi:glutaredoxin